MRKSVTKFYVLKYFWILMKLSDVVVKYHKNYLMGMRKQSYFNQFFRREKKN